MKKDNHCHNHQDCIDTAIQKAEAVCFRRRIKLTQLRKNILKIIWESHVPLKAYDILERLKIEDKSAKPITIYRILDIFLENRIVHKIESQNRFLGCSHPGEDHHCYFIICKKCNKVQEICDLDILNDLYSNLKIHKFKIKHLILEILGICSSCA